MNRCDECGKVKRGVETYECPGGAVLYLCPACARKAGFQVSIELRNYDEDDQNYRATHRAANGY